MINRIRSSLVRPFSKEIRLRPKIQTRGVTSISTKDHILDIREQFRIYGSTDDDVSMELACDLNDSGSYALKTLGESTAIVTISNPSSRNALTPKMMAKLADIVDSLEQDDVLRKSTSCIMLRGCGNFFCAGADIGSAKEHLGDSDGGRLMSTLMIDTLRRLRRLPYISVASIEGMAIGGGAELATATDYRIMHGQASIRFVHARMGVTPGWGGGTRLVKLVGRQNALKLLGTAESCSAVNCLNMGLIDIIVPPEKTMNDACKEFLEPFVQNSDTTVLQGAKQVVAEADDSSSLQESLAREQEQFLQLWGGEANRDALNRGRKHK